MSRITPEPVLIPKQCSVCYARTPFLKSFEGSDRCRECLRDLLPRAPKGAKRRRLLRLLDSPDLAQGHFNWEE